jgi:hypothetical protein
METLSRKEGLGAMVVEKWLRDNHRAGHHLEVYDPDKLHSLMLSRISKLSRQVAEGEIEPMRIHADSLDKIFQSILDAGLLTPINPKVAGPEEERRIREAADREQLSTEADFMLAILQYEKTAGQQGISDWYHHKATRQQKEWYDRLFPSGAATPESPAPQQANLFIVKATFNDGRIKYISGDTNLVPLDSTVAHRFGKTNAERFATALQSQRPELKRIEIVPLEGAFATSAKESDINATAEALNKEALAAYLQKPARVNDFETGAHEI